MASVDVATNESSPSTNLTRVSIAAWVRTRLFNTWYNGAITAAIVVLSVFALKTAIPWLVSAPWGVVSTNLRILLVGPYPGAQLWRVGVGTLYLPLVLGMAAGLWPDLVRKFAVGFGVLLFITAIGSLRIAALSIGFETWFFSSTALLGLGYLAGARGLIGIRGLLALSSLLFVLQMVLLWGIGKSMGLPVVPTDQWGGLLLTFLFAQAGIAVVFPLGLALALARRSDLWFFRWFATGFIEVFRAIPLIASVFIAVIMLPIMFPPSVTPNRLLLAFLALVFNDGAYMAENIRGGLQAIPGGQIQAAQSLGLRPWQITWRIVLPQAIRVTIPAIVGQFIILFKDTAILSLVGMVELLGIGTNILVGQFKWQSDQAEMYLFIAAVYWIFTFGMSQVSRGVERRMRVGED